MISLLVPAPTSKDHGHDKVIQLPSDRSSNNGEGECV